MMFHCVKRRSYGMDQIGKKAQGSALRLGRSDIDMININVLAVLVIQIGGNAKTPLVCG